MTALAAPERTRVRLRTLPWDLIVAATVSALFVIAAIWPQVLATYDPFAMDLGAALQPPSLAHWFGTDEAGRDLYSRVVYGTRESLGIGVGAAAVTVTQATMITQASTNAATVSTIVAPSWSATMSMTGRCCWYEMPRSPRASPDT
ncbi:MAG TPA: hypothetical protein VM430_08955 [Microbacterium sp.]|nr:hypothetical protein [Microbacterium sp.]